MSDAGQESELLRIKLADQLQKLSWGLGVWEPKLARRLATDLRELQSVWMIDVSATEEQVRLEVIDNLNTLIAGLDVRPSKQPLSAKQRKEQFASIVKTSFNADASGAMRGEELTTRRKWWQDKDRLGDSAVSYSSTQRDLDAAIEQMAEVLVKQKIITGQILSTAGDASDGEDESDSSRKPSRWPKFVRTHPVLFSAAALLLSIVLIGVPIAVNRNGERAEAGDPERSAATAPQDVLRSTLTNVASLGGGLGIVYASDQNDHAKDVAAELTKVNAGIEGDKAGTGVYDKDYDIAIREVQRGEAYLLRGMQIAVQVEGLADSEIVIYDVVVRSAVKSTPLGSALVLYNAGGGDDPRKMRFNMDKPNPIARQDAGPNKTGAPFFETERIGLSKGHKETLIMFFQAESVASEFNIEIRYEVGGKKYTEKVDLFGHPFRIAPVACQPLIRSSVAPPAEVRQVQSSLYQHAYNFGYGRSDEQGSMDPKKFSEFRCNF